VIQLTTYGPRSLSLMERLVSAHLVAVIKQVRFVNAEVDEQSEHGRELGTFEVVVASVLDGDAPGEVIRIRVAPAAEGDWPFPESGRFLALLQRDPPGDGYVLVHDSAFALRGSTFMFNEQIGAGPRARGSKATTLATVRRLLKERREQLAERAGYFAHREGRAIKATPPRFPTEMPDSEAVVFWLDTDRTTAGREGKPGQPARGGNRHD
jgi:hypothetical protein